MPLAIAVLEDDVRRRLEMQRVAADRFWMYDILFFDTPAMLCQWLERNQDRTLAISLDHDLNRIEEAVLPDDEVREVGTGLDAAKWLADQTPFCPVAIHSTNETGAAKMDRLLVRGGWSVRKVVPTGDLEWIGRVWMRTMQAALAATSPLVGEPNSISAVSKRNDAPAKVPGAKKPVRAKTVRA